MNTAGMPGEPRLQMAMTGSVTGEENEMVSLTTDPLP
jgi:hypothetical protein